MKVDGELEARMLVDRREALTRRRVASANRLQALLAELLPGQAKKDITTGQAKQLLASVRPQDIAGKTCRRVAAEELAELVAVDAKIRKATAELRTLVLERDSTLMDLHGVGPVVAARVLADVGDIARSPTGTGSRPGLAPHPWTPPPESRTSTAFPGPGTGG